MTDAINFDASLLKGAIAKRSERKKADNETIQSAFTKAKTDGQLNKQELEKLKELGLTKDQIKNLSKTEDGMQTLNDLVYSHLGADFGVKTGDNAAAEIRQQRQVEIAEFVLDDEVKTHDDFKARLAQFEGVEFVDDQFIAEAEDLYITEKLGRAKTTFTPDVGANPEAKPAEIRVQAEKAEDGTVAKLNLYEATGEEVADANPDEAKPTRTLVANGKYFTEGEGDEVKYYSYNAQAGALTDVTTKVKTEAAEQQRIQGEIGKLADYAPKEGDADFQEYTDANDATKLVMLQNRKVAKEQADEIAKYGDLVPQGDEKFDKMSHAEKIAHLEQLKQTRETEQQAERERLQTIEDRRTAFQNIRQNGVTIDETGSKQRLTNKEQWNTGVVIPKKATVNENGYPSQIAIELPGEYGSIGPDGVAQKRYQTLYFNEETQTYADKRGLRQFEVNINDGKITLKQVDINDKNVKAALDADTAAFAAKAKEAALNENQTKFKDTMTKDDVTTLMSKLADRNSSWETYLQAGTENGYLTGTLGLFEELFDEDHAKSFNDIKPALDGLAARVPEDLKDEFKPVQDIIDKLAANPNEDVGTNQFFHFYGGDIRDLDLALLDFAKNHMAGRVQGTNHANNSYLVGGTGENKVTIQPEKESSMWMSDAKFTIGGKDYNLYETRDIMDRTIDFQDLVQHKDDGKRDELTLLSNDVTGNNRYGEIKANAERFAADNFYFKGADGVKHNCVVEDGVVYVQSPDGQVKVPLEDVLNGRKPMPEDAPPAPTA